MPIYRNAFYWFIGLLVLLILGFLLITKAAINHF